MKHKDILNAPIGDNIRSKHLFYLDQMRQLDKSNNEITAQIERIESNLGKLNKQLNEGRQLREKYRRKVGLYKKMYHAGNKFKSDNNIKS